MIKYFIIKNMNDIRTLFFPLSSPINNLTTRISCAPMEIKHYLGPLKNLIRYTAVKLNKLRIKTKELFTHLWFTINNLITPDRHRDLICVVLFNTLNRVSLMYWYDKESNTYSTTGTRFNLNCCVSHWSLLQQGSCITLHPTSHLFMDSA